jgi:hypothetical protein
MFMFNEERVGEESSRSRCEVRTIFAEWERPSMIDMVPVLVLGVTTNLRASHTRDIFLRVDLASE